jgi:uncharacterized protein (UPF0276 family)
VDRVAVGLGVRDEWLEGLVALADRRAVDVLEIMIDDGLEPCLRRDKWRRLGARWPLVAHGTELGVAGAQGLDDDYLGRVGAALSELHVRWYSEHLAFVRTKRVELGHFAPLSSSPEGAALLAKNAASVRAKCACPFLLENPADVLGWESEGGGRALGESYGAMLVAAEAGGLLDLTNLVLGARNDGYDAMEFVEGVPLERVVEVHLAGGRHDGELWIDSHDHDVDDEALGLLERIAKRMPGLRAVVIERDEALPTLDAMLAEVERVRSTLARAGVR